MNTFIGPSVSIVKGSLQDKFSGELCSSGRHNSELSLFPKLDSSAQRVAESISSCDGARKIVSFGVRFIGVVSPGHGVLLSGDRTICWSATGAEFGRFFSGELFSVTKTAEWGFSGGRSSVTPSPSTFVGCNDLPGSSSDDLFPLDKSIGGDDPSEVGDGERCVSLGT